MGRTAITSLDVPCLTFPFYEVLINELSFFGISSCDFGFNGQ